MFNPALLHIIHQQSCKTHITVGNDQVNRVLLLASKVTPDDLLGTFSISGLSIKSSARVVGHHAVTPAERIGHVPPGVVLGSGLNVCRTLRDTMSLNIP